MTRDPPLELSSASHILSESSCDSTEMNSLGHDTGDEVQHNSCDNGVMNISFVSGEERPHNPPEPSARSSDERASDGHDISGKQSTNYVATHHEEITGEKSCEAQNGGLKLSKMSYKNKWMLFMLAMESILSGCLYSLPALFFPQEGKKKGVSPTVNGLVFSCYELVCFLACPLFGSWIMHLGAKFTYVSGILMAGACSILFGFLDQRTSRRDFILMSFLVRSVEAVGVAAFTTAGFAIVSNEFPNHIGSVFATLETCVGIGLMVGPTVGATFYEVGGYGFPFWAIGAFIFCTGLIVMTCFPQPRDNKMPNKESFFSLLRSMMVWIACLSVFLPACGISYMNATLSVYLDQFGLSTFQNGLFFVIAPGLYAALAPLLGFISDKKDFQSPLLIIGNLFCGVGFLFIGTTPLLPFLPREIWVTSVGLVVYGLAVGCSFVPTMKCLVTGASELGFPDGLSTLGKVSGLFNATYCLGAFVGPTIGGAMVEKMGFEYGCTIISGYFFVLTLVTCVYFGHRNLKKKSESVTSEIVKPSPTINQSSKLFELSKVSEKSQLVLHKAPKKSRLCLDSLRALFAQR